MLTPPPPPPPDPVSAAVASGLSTRLTRDELGYMFGACARNPLVFAAARQRLTTTMLERAEAHFILFWRALTAAADANAGTVPADRGAAKELVSLKAAAEAATDPAEKLYTADAQQIVFAKGGMLDYVFGAGPADPGLAPVEDEAIAYLIRFMTERTVSDPLRRAVAGVAPGEAITDVGALVAAIERHAADIAGVARDPGADGVVSGDDFLPPGVLTIPTRAPWLDGLMGGGHAGREAYVILGPTSGGKTSLGVSIAVDGAELQASLIPDVGPSAAGYWYLFTYELDLDMMRERIYSYGARVSRQTLNTRDPRTRRIDLSTAADPQTLKGYEREAVVNTPGRPVRGELERVRDFNARLSGLNSRLVVVDYSGTVPGQGVGGVDEVVGYLRAQVARGRRVAGAVIDYAGIAVKRHVAAKNLPPDAEYPMLNGYVDQVRTRVAIPFDCPVWVLHQFHGDVTKRAAGARMHHSEASGARNIADNADFAFGIAPYNKVTGLTTISMSKHRRVPGRESGVIVHYDGRFGLFSEPAEQYAIDGRGDIVRKDDLDVFAGPPAGPAAPPVDPLAGV